MKAKAQSSRFERTDKPFWSVFLSGILFLGIGGGLTLLNPPRLRLIGRFELIGSTLPEGYESDATIEILDQEVLLTFDALETYWASPTFEDVGTIVVDFIFSKKVATESLPSQTSSLFDVHFLVGEEIHRKEMTAIALGTPLRIVEDVTGPFSILLICRNFDIQDGISSSFSLKTVAMYHFLT